jgi:hypothetical protein
MKTSGQRRVVLFVSAVVFLFQISHALASGPSGVQGAIQGSRFPGMPAPVTERVRDGHRRIEVTFTKWVATAPLLAGFTGGDVVGDFVGEVLQSQLSLNGRILRLEAVYEVQAGDRSFTALIRGGRTTNPGDAILEGVILEGWRTGARVHVEFHVRNPASPTEPGCDGAPAGIRCFEGTIVIERASKD